MKYILLPTVSLLFSLSCFCTRISYATDDKNLMPQFHQNLTQSNKKRWFREVIITANKEKKPVSALRSGLNQWIHHKAFKLLVLK
jgi:iron complex outermembrane receptor protein